MRNVNTSSCCPDVLKLGVHILKTSPGFLGSFALRESQVCWLQGLRRRAHLMATCEGTAGRWRDVAVSGSEQI